MNVTSGSCSQESLPGLSSAISSPGSAGGPTRCGSRGGRMTNQSGLEVAPASRLVLLAKDWENLTKDTCGRISEISSESAVLQRCLESRLRARLPLDGSPEFRLIWKTRLTPLGRPICALRASGPRTSDNDFFGWPTPNTPSGGPNSKRKERGSGGPDLEEVAGWSVPISLEQEAVPAGWPTPNVPNGGRSCKEMSSTGMMPDGTKRQAGLEHVVKMALTGWNTPRATDGSNGGPNQAGGALPADAALAGWPTPEAEEARRGFQNRNNGKKGTQKSLTTVVKEQIFGPDLTSSPAGTESPGALNPAHSRWLMGYPAGWDYCGATAMRSIQSSRRSSSARTAKRGSK